MGPLLSPQGFGVLDGGCMVMRLLTEEESLPPPTSPWRSAGGTWQTSQGLISFLLIQQKSFSRCVLLSVFVWSQVTCYREGVIHGSPQLLKPTAARKGPDFWAGGGDPAPSWGEDNVQAQPRPVPRGSPGWMVGPSPVPGREQDAWSWGERGQGHGLELSPVGSISQWGHPPASILRAALWKATAGP